MEKIYREIYSLHKSLLENTERNFKGKIIICFSGVPGSGKTTLAKAIEEKYRGVRINTHDIGKIVRELVKKKAIKEDEDIHEIQNGYQYWLIDKRPFNNSLIILDSGIERKYKEIFKMAKERDYRYFVICLNVSDKILRERIRLREGENAENYFKEFPRWKKEFQIFKKKYKSDLVTKNDEDLDLNLVFKRLDKILL